MDNDSPDIGLQVVELPITNPESGTVHNLFLVAKAEMTPQEFDQIFNNPDLTIADVLKNAPVFHPPRDFLEAAGDKRMQDFIDHIGQGIDAVARD